MKSVTFVLASLFLAVALSGCATGKRSAEKSAAEASTPDITRPPTLVVDKSDEPAESNPEETVSFDKWKKKTAEQQKAQEQAAKEPEQSE